MNFILFILLQNLSSVLCLNCFDVRQSKGFGIFVRRDKNGGRSYWIYDRNGKEWEMYLKEKDEQIDIDGYEDKSVAYDEQMVNRFGNYMHNYLKGQRIVMDRVSYICYNPINSSLIVCDFTKFEDKPISISKDVKIKDPLIFKTFPKTIEPRDNHIMAYNRHNKLDRVRIRMTNDPDIKVLIEKYGLTDIEFIGDMNDTLFSQIDSIIEYHSERGLSGHMLWFNIDHKYYYCFQSEGKPLSEQVISEMNRFLVLF